MMLIVSVAKLDRVQLMKWSCWTCGKNWSGRRRSMSWKKGSREIRRKVRCVQVLTGSNVVELSDESRTSQERPNVVVSV